MSTVAHRSLYEINTRVVLRELGTQLGRKAAFDDIPDAYLDAIAAKGFDYVWMLGVWTTGPMGREVSRTQSDWREGYRQDLADFTDDDICGSPFAIRKYEAHPDFGGEAALARLRQRLKSRGIGLFLDFVPNHVALDHPWVDEHPEFLMAGTEEALQREPQNYIRRKTASGDRIFAHGRDPYFPGWADTIQLDYRHPGLRTAMAGIIADLATRCDGLRCDMAMLELPEQVARIWGQYSPQGHTVEPFWAKAIRAVKSVRPDFLFMAEVYWDLEWPLMGEGFDFTYDKRLYDGVRDRDVRAIRGHFCADAHFQAKSARFLENHDEPRALAVWPGPEYESAAILTYLIPGLRFFHEGQFEGRTHRANNHLSRRLNESANGEIAAFYNRLMPVVDRPIFRTGTFALVGCNPAWWGNDSCEQFIAWSWCAPGMNPILVVVNFSDRWGQCYAREFHEHLPHAMLRFTDLTGTAVYDRDGSDIGARGLYLDMPPWGYHVFEITRL